MGIWREAGGRVKVLRDSVQLPMVKGFLSTSPSKWQPLLPGDRAVGLKGSRQVARRPWQPASSLGPAGGGGPERAHGAHRGF